MTLADSNLQDVSANNLMQALPDLLAKETPHYVVEYGLRYDDGALVFHFFPAEGEYWDPTYKMDQRLERAIRETFDTDRVSADYQEEIRSFCVIFGGAAHAPDPLALAPMFFEWIDAPLGAPS